MRRRRPGRLSYCTRGRGTFEIGKGQCTSAREAGELLKERRKYNTTRGREIFEIGKFSRARASLGRKMLKSEKNSALENNFSTVAEGENFREAKANFFPEVDFVCVCAPVAIISRAVWKLRNGISLVCARLLRSSAGRYEN